MKSFERRQERGAALLFAMGILALFLLMAMGFASYSLLQRKIAANRASKAMTEVIVESALTHAKTMIQLYQSRQAGPWHSDFDINFIRPLGGAADDRFGPLGGGYNEKVNGTGDWALVHSDRYDWDDYISWSQICPDFKDPGHNLSCPWCSDDDYFWRLVFADEEGVGSRIIGRYTFFGLHRLPKQFFFDLDADGDVYIRTFDGIEDYILREAPAANIESAAEGIETNYLPELDVCVIPPAGLGTDEAFPTFRDYRYRFPLSRDEDGESTAVTGTLADGATAATVNVNLDGWSSITPENLLEGDLAEFFAHTGNALDYVILEGELMPRPANPSGSNGIPALRFVGDSAGTFADIATRRLQVAANLIDYCDDDNYPTSDVDEGDWKDLSQTAPSYTGNEKTLYIDRFGLAMRLHGELDGGAMLFRARADVVGMAGLVDLYEEHNLENYKLEYLGSQSGRIRIDTELERTYVISYEYYDNSSGVPVAVSVPNEMIHLAAPVTGTFTLDNSKLSGTMDIDDGSSASYQGYTFGSASLAANEALDGSIDISVSIPELAAAGTPFASRVADLVPGSMVMDGLYAYLRVKEVQYDVSRLVLSGEDSGTVINVDLADFYDGANDYLEFTHDFSGDQHFALSFDSFVSGNNISVPWGMGGIFCKDPRQNLNPDDWYRWNDSSVSIPDDYVRATVNIADVPEALSRIRKMIGSREDLTDLFTLALKNGIEPLTDIAGMEDRNPHNPYDAGTGVAQDDERDMEIVETPAWVDDSDDGHLSTAFFRNGGMESLAELGFIHRGARWETLNLSNALFPGGSRAFEPGDFTSPGSYTSVGGTKYSEGDGAILDQVTARKTPEQWRDEDNTLSNYESLRKFLIAEHAFDINLRDGSGRSYNSGDPGDEYYMDLLTFVSLGILQSDPPELDDLADLEKGHPLVGADWNSNTGELTGLGEALAGYMNWRFTDDSGIDPATPPGNYASRSQFLAQGYKSGGVLHCLGNGFGQLDGAGSLKMNKGLADELCGKVMEHSYAGMPPTTFKVLIIAQSIRDIGGTGGSGFSVTKEVWKETSEKFVMETNNDVKMGSYEPGFDEITGQLRVLYTLGRDPLTGKVFYLDKEILQD